MKKCEYTHRSRSNLKTLIRGKSINYSNEELAILKYANIKLPDVDVEKNRQINTDKMRSLISSHIHEEIRNSGKTKWHENKTGNEIEMTYTIEIGPDLIIGKSTTSSLSKAEEGREQRNPRQKAISEAMNEAKKKFNNHFFGVDGIKEFTIDEMGRPVETN